MFGFLKISLFAQTDLLFNWAKALNNTGFGGDIEGLAIKVDSSGSSYVTGYFYGTADFDPSNNTASLSSNGGSDIFLAKYDASGNYVFATKIGGKYNDVAKSMVLDGNGNIYLAGIFCGTVDFNPSLNATNLLSADTILTDIRGNLFFAKYDMNGNYVWAKAVALIFYLT